MNIKQAKQQIKNAMTAYFSKDEFGSYRIPIERQRPIFLMGAPGIGKTAIMEQIAEELGVALVSYSMTHHTRQSALGLPFIVKKTYGGVEYNVSEYTMSEIIASVYDTIEETGLHEGILFLDEINCVSETLAPAMLQFLQFKTFGRHRVPDGFIVVTAGNPPEYNRSVREFDIVTWDRLKRIDVEPDFDAWKEFASNKHMHPAVLTYLSIKKEHFYKVETTVHGKRFVTARGWDDLSEMLKLYEEHDLPVDLHLIGQYLQNSAIAKDFAAYYDLYHKYRADYQIEEILCAEAPDAVKERARNARLDERLALLSLLLDAVTADMREVLDTETVLFEVSRILKSAKKEAADPPETLHAALERHIIAHHRMLKNSKRTALSAQSRKKLMRVTALLEEFTGVILRHATETEAYAAIQEQFNARVCALKAAGERTSNRLAHIFQFVEDIFGDDELVVLVTELTVNHTSADFIGRFGCEAYFAHNKELLFYERQREILKEIDGLS